MSKAEPLSLEQRARNYFLQGGRSDPTPRQVRRMTKKFRRAQKKAMAREDPR